jgi:hypothetical protein
MSTAKKLSTEEYQQLLEVLKDRFVKHMSRHEGFNWHAIQERLDANAEKQWSLSEMERTGGEPDVVDFDEETNEYIFCDCAIASPNGRRSLCYDRAAYDARKDSKPENNVLDVAATIGIELLTEQQYRNLQQFGNFDTKTSSWLKTPTNIRNLGGAIFADYRYRTVFVYHNGASSYYAARGFRGLLRV